MWSFYVIWMIYIIQNMKFCSYHIWCFLCIPGSYSNKRGLSKYDATDGRPNETHGYFEKKYEFLWV